MADFFWECISIAVKLFIQSICQKVIEFASDAARWILEPSSRSALPAVTTKVITNVSSDDVQENIISTAASSSSTPKRSGSWDIIKTASSTSNRVDQHWKNIEGKILQDIEPLASIAKSILHSGKYKNGDRLTEKDVIENLLNYHYGFEKKFGSGLSYIMVDRHVEFEYKRCIYVVRTDGMRKDFSYKKCLRGYVEHKYPAHAKRFAKLNRHLVK